MAVNVPSAATAVSGPGLSHVSAMSPRQIQLAVILVHLALTYEAAGDTVGVAGCVSAGCIVGGTVVVVACPVVLVGVTEADVGVDVDVDAVVDEHAAAKAPLAARRIRSFRIWSR